MLLSLTILSFFFFSSCKKNTGGNNPPSGSGGDSVYVYLAGKNGAGEPNPPCFWKNMVLKNLPTTAGGDANSIFVSGQNVYVAGRNWMNNAQTRFSPCYWLSENRVSLPLLDDRGDGMANSILAFNGTVYAAGTCTDSLEFFGNSGWRYLPVFWKNGQVIRLETLDGFGGGFGESIGLMAATNTVYPVIAGSSHAASGYDEPCYWSLDPNVVTTPGAEHEATPLSNKGYGGAAKNVAVQQPQSQGILNGLYIAGWIDNADGVNEPCYWSGGSRTDLSKITPSGHGAATAIHVSGNDVYVAGYSSKTGGSHVPCMWKNGTRTDLPLPANTNSGEATSCKMLNGDIYVAGTLTANDGEYPCYWKNGTLVQYNSRGIARSIALSDN